MKEFRKVWVASGALGFFGEGYWFHRWLKHFGLDFDDATFTAKTTTLYENRGNMARNLDFTPRDHFPDCIYVDWRNWLRGNALNAIRLSGPGAFPLISAGLYQERTKPFFLSFMSIEQARDKRLDELKWFLTILDEHLPRFKTRPGLQLNFSCPNTGHELDELLKEVDATLTVAGRLGIKIVVKLNALAPVEAARDISQHPHCDALCVSNTIPYGKLPELIPWEKYFGAKSPLEKYGGGGYSGKLLLPIGLKWLHNARACGITKHINYCGGILKLADAKMAFSFGADSISLGSIAFLRPWRVRGIIRAINRR